MASVWGAEFVLFLAALAVLPKVYLKEKVEFILFFQFDLVKTVSAARNWTNFDPQTDATNFALSSIILSFFYDLSPLHIHNKTYHHQQWLRSHIYHQSLRTIKQPRWLHCSFLYCSNIGSKEYQTVPVWVANLCLHMFTRYKNATQLQEFLTTLFLYRLHCKFHTGELCSLAVYCKKQNQDTIYRTHFRSWYVPKSRFFGKKAVHCSGALLKIRKRFSSYLLNGYRYHKNFNRFEF